MDSRAVEGQGAQHQGLNGIDAPRRGRAIGSAGGLSDDPIEILAKIAKTNPDIAGQLAAQHGLPLDFIKDSEARAIAERKLESLAFTWIRDNAARAKELADF